HTRFSRDWTSDVCSSDLLRELRVLVAVGMLGLVLRPQQHQRDMVVAPRELLAHPRPVRKRPGLRRRLRRSRVQTLLEFVLVKALHLLPARQPRGGGSLQAVGERRLAAGDGAADLPKARRAGQQTESEYVFDFSHRKPLLGHRFAPRQKGEGWR